MSDEQANIDNLDTSNARYKPLTPEQRARKQARFLARYRKSGNVKFSCSYAGISRQTFYNWRDTDDTFKAQLADAEPDVDDTLNYAAYERGVEGVPSYVVSNGHMVYEEIPVMNPDGTPKLNKQGGQVYLRGKPLVERKYSDTLLVTLLKARMPEKYRERSAIEHTGKDGGPIKVDHTDYSKFSDEELDLLERMAQKVKDGGN